MLKVRKYEGSMYVKDQNVEQKHILLEKQKEIVVKWMKVYP